jgi:ribosomal protein L21
MEYPLVQLILKKVLMLGSKNETMIGRPVLVDSAVHAVVEEHVRLLILHFLFKSEKI